MASFDSRLDIDHKLHKDYIDRVIDLEQHFRMASLATWDNALTHWNRFLAIQEDKRDPVDEKWRSQIFVPMPFSASMTKVSQLVETLGNTEPVWQVEAMREDPRWMEQARPVEKLLEYTHIMNAWRKFLFKALLNRSVVGHAWIKVVWQKRAHTIMDYPNSEDQRRFLESIDHAQTAGAPAPPDWRANPKGFKEWQKAVNLAGLHGEVMDIPRQEFGPREIVEYEGPTFQLLPLWRVLADPLIDEVADQKVIIHVMVKPQSYLLARADNDPDSDKPFILKNVQEALGSWDGNVQEIQETDLADALGVTPDQRNHPYYEKAVTIWEVWSGEEVFKHAIILNQKVVINKRPFEAPLLTSHPNLFALRNVLVPGHLYGLSDYHESAHLFDELNTFRRLRMDRAVLNTLPVFARQMGVRLGDQLRRITPGAVVDIAGPVNQAIKPLIEANSPPDAYREPQEIKLEIEDATGVPNYTKGAAATVGRVTGTEFAGRAGQIGLRFKVDASFIEDELASLPKVILSFWAQMGKPETREEIAGEPDPLVQVPRAKLIEAIGWRFKFRGATKNIQPDLLVQQLNTTAQPFLPDLTPKERRELFRKSLEILDIRGTSKILTEEGEQQISGTAGAMGQAGMAQAGAMTQQARVAGAGPAPATLSPQEAQALNGGGNGGQPS